MILRHLSREKGKIILFIISLAGATAALAYMNLKIQDVFTAAEHADYARLMKLFAAMFFAFVTIRTWDYLNEVFSIQIINTIRNNLKSDLFSGIIRKQLFSFAEKDSSEYIAEFTNDITVIENKFLIAGKELITYIITIVSLGTAITTVSVSMGVIILVGAVLCIAFPIYASRYTTRIMDRFILRFERYIQRLSDFFSMYFTIRNFAAEQEIVQKFREENCNVEEQKFDAELSLVAVNNITGRIAWMIELSVFMIGIIEIIRGTLPLGGMVAAYMLAGQLGIPLQSIGNRIGQMRSVRGIERKFARASSAVHGVSLAAPGSTEERIDIVLDDLSLKLDDNPVLRHVSFRFEPRRKYLILGSNGSGKSSIARLLKSTYREYSGSVRISGVELNSPEGRNYSRLISFSNETVSLISDTVYNNILLYRDDLAPLVEPTVQRIGLSVPLDRQVGDSGSHLSSGERRRIEIARSLLDSPQVLILDEVVSTLDIMTAYEIEKLFLSMEDKMVIMISNAFSGALLDQYDEIILLDQGEIAAHGRHEELLEQSELYRQIYECRCGLADAERGAAYV